MVVTNLKKEVKWARNPKSPLVNATGQSYIPDNQTDTPHRLYSILADRLFRQSD